MSLYKSVNKDQGSDTLLLVKFVYKLIKVQLMKIIHNFNIELEANQLPPFQIG